MATLKGAQIDYTQEYVFVIDESHEAVVQYDESLRKVSFRHIGVQLRPKIYASSFSSVACLRLSNSRFKLATVSFSLTLSFVISATV